MEENRYLFMPKISLKPDRVTAFNEVLIRNRTNGNLESISKTRQKIYDFDTFEEIILKKSFHNFKISPAGQKTIQNKINWLYVMAKSRYQKTYSGKEIFNFKINFLTLTLPSKQIHPTFQITNECFNQFLTEIRQRTKMENYLWRLEFQGNGNLHYHIVTDTFIDYFLAQKIWNRIINKLGYVDKFTEKFSSMTLSEYDRATNAAKKWNFDVVAKRFAKATAEKWTNPPSIDVKVCTSNKAIAYYISKYFGKKSDKNPIQNDLDNEENSFGLRLWFCSRSLSKLNSVVDYVENCEINFFDFIKDSGKAIEMIFDYAKCLFFNISDFSNYYKSVIIPVLKDYAKLQGYIPA
jgi:hypothetical protein